MLEKDHIRRAMLFPVVSISGKHYVCVKDNLDNEEEQRINIEDLHYTFSEKNDMRLYNYFTSLINLCASICMQRNYKCIKVLENVYKLEMVNDCTMNSQLPFDLRACFARLLITLHMDKDPLEKLNIPVMTRKWEDVLAD